MEDIHQGGEYSPLVLRLSDFTDDQNPKFYNSKHARNTINTVFKSENFEKDLLKYKIDKTLCSIMSHLRKCCPELTETDNPKTLLDYITITLLDKTNGINDYERKAQFWRTILKTKIEDYDIRHDHVNWNSINDFREISEHVNENLNMSWKSISPKDNDGMRRTVAREIYLGYRNRDGTTKPGLENYEKFERET